MRIHRESFDFDKVTHQLSVDEFLNIVEEEPNKFIGYCEILILPNGNIIQAIPSHIESLIQVASELLDEDKQVIRDESPVAFDPVAFLLDRFGIISVWYNHIRISQGYKYKKWYRENQKKTLDILINKNLIYKDYAEDCTREYRLYIQRLENGEEFMSCKEYREKYCHLDFGR